VLRRAFRNHRPGLALTAVVAIVAIATLVATAVVNQRGDRGSANEPQAEEPPPSLGIDLIHCPKAEPEELPPYALAGATEAALDQVPSVFGHVIAYVEGEALTSEGAYAGSAYLTEGGRASRPGDNPRYVPRAAATDQAPPGPQRRGGYAFSGGGEGEREPLSAHRVRREVRGRLLGVRDRALRRISLSTTLNFLSDPAVSQSGNLREGLHGAASL
jgi:hypothetical protein